MLDVFYIAYIDNILIYSNSKNENREHIHHVLKVLQKTGLQANINKSEFHVTKVIYFSMIITTDGIRIDLKKIKVVQK